MSVFADIIASNEMVVLTISLQAGGNAIGSLVRYERKGKDLKLTDTFEFSGLESLKEKTITTVPVVIVISGKGVIGKSVAVDPGEDRNVLLSKTIPNVTKGDLSSQLSIADGKGELVMIRRTMLGEILEQIVAAGFTQIQDCILIAGNTMNISEEMVRQLWSREIKGVDDDRFLNGLMNEYKDRIRFKKKVAVILSLVFFVLLLNFLVFDHYRSIHNEISGSLLMNVAELDRYQKLKTETDQKRTFLEQNGFLGASQSSFYADRLAAILPNSMSWSSLSIYPLLKKKDDTEPIGFDNRLIRVEGKCSKSADLNEWMKQLKKSDWVRNVELINYSQEAEKAPGNFVVALQLR